MNHTHITRRSYLKVSLLGLSSTMAALTIPRLVLAQTEDEDTPFNFISDPENPTELEAQHMITMRLPIIAEDGSNVPIVISLDNHPMDEDHYITHLRMYNFSDPIVAKGVYEFTPANGMAYISTQVRMDGGEANLYAVAECNQHGLWAANQSLKVSLGGC